MNEDLKKRIEEFNKIKYPNDNGTEYEYPKGVQHKFICFSLYFIINKYYFFTVGYFTPS